MFRQTRLIPAAVVLVLGICTPVWAQYSGGTGEPNSPYEIDNVDDLLALAGNTADYGECFILTSDINLALAEPNVFATAVIAPDGSPEFTGSFDGDGHIIRNLTIDTEGASGDYLGLFGEVDSPAEIMNLHLENVSITAADESEYLGGLCGKSYYGNITNCSSIASVSGTYRLGGLVGYNDHGSISYCYTNSDISGTRDYLGGLCGRSYFGNITNCYSSGIVTGDDDSDNVGGLVGYNSNGSISYCYSSSNVSGSGDADDIGGLCGLNESYGGPAVISYCYSIGTVSCGENGYAGGLVGYNYGSVISSFWDMQTSNVTTSHGGTGLNTTEMKMAESYFAWGVCEHDGEWTIDQGNDYPRLAWENKPGAPISSPALPDILTGTGDPCTPYLIYTAQELIIAGYYTCEYDKQYELMADINMNLAEPNVFIAAVIAPSGGPQFAGVFDGANHVISNLTIDTQGGNNSYLGLFGETDTSAGITNLRLENAIITGGTDSDYLGALVGKTSGSIINCASNARVAGSSYLGSLVGYNVGTVSNCYSTGSVAGDYALGGLVGHNDNSGTISNCCSIGRATGGNAVGGLAGYSYGNISNCYSTGSVLGYNYIGGLVGSNNTGSVSNCYTGSEVTGGYEVGGLVGRCDNGSYVASFWDSDVNSTLTGIGDEPDPAEVMAQTTAQMNTQSTYTDHSWDFVDTWQMAAGGGYPRLQWQGITLAANPDTVKLYALLGQTAVATDMIDIYNSGLGTLSFTTSEDRNWLDVTPSAGTSSGQEFAVTLEVDPYALSIGTYETTVDITSPEAENGSVEVTLRVYIREYADGNGTGSDPFEIADTDDLFELAAYPQDWDMHFVLSSDIDLDPCVTGVPIFATALIAPDIDSKNWSFDGPNFVGTFDGNGHTISNLKIDTEGADSDHVGLFGQTGLTSEIRNLNLKNITITGGVDSECFGSLAGRNSFGIVSNCTSVGNVTGHDYVGGLVGRNYYGSLSNCYSNSSVTGNSLVGALVGADSYGSIRNCASGGNVTGQDYVGGLVGDIYRSTVSNCYSRAGVTGDDNIGGLIGDVYASSISYCYISGEVDGDDNVGGLVGRNYSGSYSGCLWNSEINWGMNDAGDDGNLSGVKGRSTALMKTQNTYVYEGWDFATIWTICEETNYPRLTWQILDGELVCPDWVGMEDLIYFSQRWLDSCSGDCDQRDLNNDGIVNLADYAILASSWLRMITM